MPSAQPRAGGIQLTLPRRHVLWTGQGQEVGGPGRAGRVAGRAERSRSAPAAAAPESALPLPRPAPAVPRSVRPDTGKEPPIPLQHHPSNAARCASRLCCACSPFQRSFPASGTADHQLHGIPDLALRIFQRLVPWTAGFPPTLSMPFSGAARPSQESLWSLRPSCRHFSSFPNVKRLAICLDPPPAKAARKRFFGKGDLSKVLPVPGCSPS
uniref:uncharacterized protein LOC129133358 n=1 Tax=Agelaius phoeniceus TaxID=39638 RepID=UPI0023EB1EE8|nr:uncharacterized protein LOC129133358 [Agelaius phoeniceus]